MSLPAEGPQPRFSKGDSAFDELFRKHPWAGHPRYLGETYASCWPETHQTIHPWMVRVLAGEILEVENAPITMARHGFSEETYFTFSFSPLLDDKGRIAGFLQLVTEKTAEVLAQRRAATLEQLAPDGAALADVSAVLEL